MYRRVELSGASTASAGKTCALSAHAALGGSETKSNASVPGVSTPFRGRYHEGGGYDEGMGKVSLSDQLVGRIGFADTFVGCVFAYTPVIRHDCVTHLWSTYLI